MMQETTSGKYTVLWRIRPRKKPHNFYRRLPCKASKTQRCFVLMESLTLSSLCLWSYLCVAVLNLPGCLCKHHISISLHSYIQLLIALEFAVQEATEGALLNYGLSFPKESKRLASVPIWTKVLQRHLSSPQWLCITISRKNSPLSHARSELRNPEGWAKIQRPENSLVKYKGKDGVAWSER